MKKSNAKIIFYTSENNKVVISLDDNKIYKLNELLHKIELFLKQNINNCVINLNYYIYLNNINIELIDDYYNKYSDFKLVFQQCTFTSGYIPIYNKEVHFINPIFNSYTDVFIEKTNQFFLISTNEDKRIIINKNDCISKNKITIIGNYNDLILNIKNNEEITLSNNSNAILKINTNKLNIYNSIISLKEGNINYKKIDGSNYTIKSLSPIIINDNIYTNKNKEVLLTDKDLNEKESLLLARKKIIKELKMIKQITDIQIENIIKEEYNIIHKQYKKHIDNKRKQIELLKNQIINIQKEEKIKQEETNNILQRKKIKYIRND